MKKNIGFRAWFYFRQGWSVYFAFIFAAVNTMVVTYYLAIKDIPFLKIIFPSFLHYAALWVLVGIPLLVAIGYIHYKRIAAYTSEVEINIESNPYNYKLQPGWNRYVVFPLYLNLTKMMIKWSKNEKLTDDEIKELNELQEKITILLEGGYVGDLKKDFSSMDSNKKIYKIQKDKQSEKTKEATHS